MITRLVHRYARPLVLVTALLLLVDLFLHWRQAPVHTRWIENSGASSALAGWGAVVVAFLFAYILVELIMGRRVRAVAASLAVGAAALTFLEFFLVASTVTRLEGVVVSGGAETLWPAYAGLTLAVLLVLAAVNRLFAPPEARLPLPPMLTSVRAQRGPAFDSTV